ncbi:outer membrane protein [Pelagibacterium montanilacus]|uniref:outer membrane protein n=1 Tax=Pelagibacterium montanilacus TaxID=2185280 RepID=UPI000F8EE741|nr:hypothetical protein [Pelagibacterium montanilacus]
MRKLLAIFAVGLAVATPLTAMAADPVTYGEPVYKDYVPYVPEVDEGLKGNFYLRGSLGGNLSWAHKVNHPSQDPSEFSVDRMGLGYSAGLGLGYETGHGPRFDVTVDYLHNEGMSTEITGSGPVNTGRHQLHLRSTIALANAYYDFGLGDGGLSAAGGAFGYVGAGAGIAINRMANVEPGADTATNWGGNTSFAAAGMVGAGYDFGSMVADLGYRALYINKLENDEAPNPYTIDHALIHEIRGTLRYRFN